MDELRSFNIGAQKGVLFRTRFFKPFLVFDIGGFFVNSILNQKTIKI